MEQDLQDRMKCYENVFRYNLPYRTPIIIRVDGKAFHTHTRGLKKPYDEKLFEVMNQTAIALAKEITGSVLAYVFSDEISLLIQYYKKIDSQPYFDNNLQKIVSVASGIASARFTELSNIIFNETRRAVFDARAFVIPESEVNNYFISRQQDCVRNSIAMLAQSEFSHKELDNKDSSQLQDLLMTKSINWNDYSSFYKRGRCIVKNIYYVSDSTIDNDVPHKVERHMWDVDNEIPIFSKDKNYIEGRMINERC